MHTTVCSGLYFHVVLATKDLAPLITDEISDRLRRYIASSLRGLDGEVIAAGCMPDHLHLLLHIGPAIGLSKTIASLKADSTRWAFIMFPNAHPLEWDDGYVAFTVCGRDTHRVASLIADQPERHRVCSYREEVHRLARTGW